MGVLRLIKEVLLGFFLFFLCVVFPIFAPQYTPADVVAFFSRADEVEKLSLVEKRIQFREFIRLQEEDPEQFSEPEIFEITVPPIRSNYWSKNGKKEQDMTDAEIDVLIKQAEKKEDLILQLFNICDELDEFE